MGPDLAERHQLYQVTAIDCCAPLRLVSFAEEMTISTAKGFAQFVLRTFPFPVRLVQTDNDSIFIASWAGVAPFSCAMLSRVPTSARLCWRLSP